MFCRKEILQAIFSVCAVLCLANQARAQSLPVPSRVEFLEADIRSLFKEGELQDFDGGKYAVGRKIVEDGSSERLRLEGMGEKGVVLQNGYLNLSIGAYIKHGELAGYITVQIELRFNSSNDFIWKFNKCQIEGANAGSNLLLVVGGGAVEKLAKEKIGEVLRQTSVGMKKAISEAFANKPLRISIEPGKLVICRITDLKEDLALPTPEAGWRLVTACDFDGDGKADLLWHRADNSGEPRVWLMDGARVKADLALPTPEAGWRLVAACDFDGDGKADLLWHRADNSGEPRVWLMDGVKVKADFALPTPEAGWRLVTACDFDGDGKADLLWHRTDNSGEPRAWFMDGAKVKADTALPTPDAGWRLITACDFDGDGKADLLWHRADNSGEPRVWLMTKQ